MNEFSYYVLAIISRKSMNLGALLLSSLYKGMKLWIDQLKAKDNKAIQGPMWFLFLWVNEYFLEFYYDYSLTTELVQDASTYNLCYKTVPILTFSAFQLDDLLFNMPLGYIWIFVPSSIIPTILLGFR